MEFKVLWVVATCDEVDRLCSSSYLRSGTVLRGVLL